MSVRSTRGLQYRRHFEVLVISRLLCQCAKEQIPADKCSLSRQGQFDSSTMRSAAGRLPLLLERSSHDAVKCEWNSEQKAEDRH